MRLYLAPHHDDLLISLPARLIHMARQASIQLAVLFSVEDDVLETRCRELHRTLGITVHELGESEAARRGIGPREFLRHRRRIADLDPGYVASLRDKLGGLAEQLHVREMVAPTTLVHIDHALTRAAAEALAAEGRVETLWYYPDQPYSSLWRDRSIADVARPVNDEGSVPRSPVAALVEQFEGFISSLDVRRILAGYQGDTCAVEPLWLRTAMLQNAPSSHEG